MASYAILYVVAAEGDEPKTLTFVGHEIEPFYFKSGSKGTQGAMYELAQQVCKLQKKHCKFKIAPFRSMQNMVAQGQAQVGGPLAHTPQRESLFNYSIPMYTTRYCFFTMPKNYREQMSFDDLKGKTVGVFGPSATELSLLRVREVLNKQMNVSVEPDNNTTLRKTENNTHDFGYVNCEAARIWIEKHRSQLREITSLGEKTDYYFIFSKKTFSPQDAKEFNDSLLLLKKTGYLKEIADKYKLTLAEID